MSKFKVGDKVRVRKFDTRPSFWNSEGCMDKYMGTSATISRVILNDRYEISEAAGENGGHEWWFDETDFEPIQPRREFIVIRRSGAETIAELRHDREVIKSAKATCAPSDTFDFDTGARLAFDRLMGRGEKPITGKSFDRIFVDDIAPAPAPEPPKFYTGKVVMIGSQGTDREYLINHMFKFKNGRYIGECFCGLMFFGQPYRSFEDIASTHFTSTWIEIKE